SECEGEGSTGQLPATTGAEKETVQAEATGLAPNTQYTYCLRAWNSTGQSATSPPTTFTTLPAKPGISSESVTQVGSSSATVSAQIETGGETIAYNVRYGTSEAYSNETTLANLSVPGTVSVTLTGLQPATQYHLAFHATNNTGSEQSPDTTFTTYTGNTSDLPDNRAYEMVTPDENFNAEVYTPNFALPSTYYTFRPFQASLDGNAVVYEGDPTTGGNGHAGSNLGNAHRAMRSADGGWTQETIQPIGNGFVATAYQAFSSDLSSGIVSACIGATLAPSAPVPPDGSDLPGYRLLYTRDNNSGGYNPLFTMRPRNRGAKEVPAMFGSSGVEGTFAQYGNQTVECTKPILYAGASADFHQLLFEANDSVLEGEGPLETALAEDVKKEVEEERQSNDLYVSSGGHASLVNVLPDGTPVPNATFGGEMPSTISEFVAPDFSHVISADGSRIFWTDLNTGVVYVRENGSSTVPVSEGQAQYWTASSDGRYVFYAEGEKLYRFDTQQQTREEIAGAGAEVQGALGASEDGQRLYFAADGNIAPGATAGQPNLYVWSAGSVSFVATLSTDPSNQFSFDGASDWYPVLGVHTAQVTPDGGAIVFNSASSLTGYPNNGREEVYVYEAESGGLYCASCSPTGVAGTSGSLNRSWSNTYLARSISTDGGRVFFNSESALVPQDTDGVLDVYEWERDGTGSCKLTQGCVYLLSGGQAGGALVDASASGNDVFLVTRAQLSPQDGNEMVDLYDVRVNGQQVAQTQCSGTGCQGPPASPPIFATPSSVTFNGVGNFSAPVTRAVSVKKSRVLTRRQKLARALRACHKKRSGRQRAVCEVRARKRYRAATKTSNSTVITKGR
ncbi:MAG: fibronectin type III domain-containing protein, partial [Acidimicrobiales bacterium]